jgi:uncharacterized protein YuzE
MAHPHQEIPMGVELTREQGIAAGIAKTDAEWQYDAQADAAYIRIQHGQVACTAELAEGVLVDYDADGNVLGIELLDVMDHLSHVRVGLATVSGSISIPSARSRGSVAMQVTSISPEAARDVERILDTPTED